MKNQNSEINTLRHKLEELKAKIALQKSLSNSIAMEFDVLYTEFESMNHLIDATRENSGVTWEINGVTSKKIGVTSEDIDSTSIDNGVTSEKSGATSTFNGVTREGFGVIKTGGGVTSVNVDASGALTGLPGEIVKAARTKLNLFFYRNNIPFRMAGILSAIMEKKSLPAEEMRNMTRVSRNSIFRDTAILKKLGWIVFHGSRKNGYFTLTSEGEEVIKKTANG